MNDKIIFSSCTVAFPKECNYATSISANATQRATCHATRDLTALAIQVLERNQCNSQRNNSSGGNLHNSQTIATDNISLNTIESIKAEQKKNELKRLIAEIGSYYGADMEEIEEEFKGALKSHPLDLCLISYRNLLISVQATYKISNKRVR